ETLGDGIEKTEDGILVRKAGASITLNFSGLPESETYFIMEGLDFQGIRPSEQYMVEEWNALSVYEKNQVKLEDRDWTKPEATTIQVSCGNVVKNLNYLNETGGFYTDKHDFLVNTGYRADPAGTITLSFMNPGYYSFDRYTVV